MKYNLAWFIKVAGILAGLGAGITAIYGLYNFNINKERRRISRKLTLSVKDYLKDRESFKPGGKISDLIKAENQLGDFFMRHTLPELKTLEGLTTKQLLNEKF